MENFIKGKVTPLVGTLLLCFGMVNAANANVALFDYGFNIDGATTFKADGPIPMAVDTSGFNLGTGLGTIGVTVSGAGSHYVGGFFDHEFTEQGNTFFNELGSSNGSPAAGQSWEIDEPGFLFGDIDLNLISGSLDNGIGTPAPDDVSMAMAWDFTLALGEQALISFALVDVLPVGGFFLEHNDPDSQESVYLSSTLDIRLSPIPVPAAIWLFGSGLLGLVGFSRRRQKTLR